MHPRNRLRFQQGAAYRLKRDYGQPIDIYRQDSEAYDLVTGAKTVSKSKQHVKLGVLLPGRSSRDFTQRLAYLAANKDFTYGSLYDKTLRDLLIDRKDLKGEFQTLNLNDYIVIHHRRYQIKEIEESEIETMYWLVITETKGAPIYEIHNLCMADTLCLNDSVALPVEQSIQDTVSFTETISS